MQVACHRKGHIHMANHTPRSRAQAILERPRGATKPRVIDPTGSHQHAQQTMVQRGQLRHNVVVHAEPPTTERERERGKRGSAPAHHRLEPKWLR
eukprot:8305404-Prorocentrum_lima.AAC.1